MRSNDLGVKFDDKTLQRHKLHLSKLGLVDCYVFSLSNGSQATLIALGDIKNADRPLVRIHSQCLFGDVLGSIECDCRAQLDAAMERISTENCGIIIYLQQEGRGNGLFNKAKVYALKENSGLDTVEAHKHLGLPIDAREYSDAADALKFLGVRTIRLMTNNPDKIMSIKKEGIDVKQVSLQTKPTEYNIDYLKTKQEKLNHDLGIK
jgi:3,4-dihydroxy 2-butanone 4-phosphate synthase/GTP cyclohydrolase II